MTDTRNQLKDVWESTGFIMQLLKGNKIIHIGLVIHIVFPVELGLRGVLGLPLLLLSSLGVLIAISI